MTLVAVEYDVEYCNCLSVISALRLWFPQQILKFWLFFEHLWLFLEIKKARKFWIFLAYFQSDRLGSRKTLSELHIHYKYLTSRVCYHAG